MKGKLKTKFGRYPVSFYHYIEGRAVEDDARMPDKQLVNMAKLLALIHKKSKFAGVKKKFFGSEMKLLSSQLSQARILSPDDIDVAQVGVGTIVELVNLKGKKLKYTILGPWDADPDKSILSFQSQFALEMKGHKINDSFEFKDDTYTVSGIKSYLS